MKFKFQIDHVEDGSSLINEKTAYVKINLSQIPEGEKEGIIRVRFNDHGIFPVPEDIASFAEMATLRRLVGVELKRYIKPQKRFL